MMSDVRPLIGLTAYRTHAAWGVWHTPAALLPHAYADHVTAAGGVPVLLPIGADDAAAAVIPRLDGLILSGGPDIEPVRYGASPDPFAERSQADRDTWETALLMAALQADLPVLGICRGLQLINVCLGGTLHQHLPDLAGGERHRPAPGVYGTVRVRLDTSALPGSLLGEGVDVPCHHHQAIDRLGSGLVASAWAQDGTIEAAWVPRRRFLLGVQWHPEVRDDPALFTALVKATG
jgi:gamma-glutamyl-gamma-aminobutyrate hydrolase PuuD